MTGLTAEFRERRIWRVLVAYPSVTFIWLQAVEFFINNFDLDERLLTVSLIAAVVLFPAAVIWNWQHGEAGSQAVSKPEAGAYIFFGVTAVLFAGWYWNATPAVMRATDTVYAPARTIAVMPFENAAGDADVQFLCDGIAESLINWLATVNNIKVISKSAAFRLRDYADDTAKIADALGVDGIIRGKLERIGDQVVVSTSFVDTRDDSQLWGERLMQPAKEVIYLERSIVETIKDGLRIEVAGDDASLTAAEGTEIPAAYEHYMRGHYLIQSTNTESIEAGLEELRKAVRLDPQYAHPYADIADALSQFISYGYDLDESLITEANAAAYRAVALAPNLPEAQTALASMLQWAVFDWDAVDAAYEAAVALSPQSPVTYHRYADYLVLTLRFDRAREMAGLAVERDALNSSAMHAVGLAAMFAGDFPEAAEAFGEWNQVHPESRWSYVKYALALALNGQCEESLAMTNKLDTVLNRAPSVLMESWIAWGHKVCGHENLYQQSRDRLQAARNENPDDLNPGYVYLLALEGDAEALIDLLNRLVDARSPLTAFISIFAIDYLGWPVSNTMPTNPEYRALRQRLNFPVIDI
jgi:TolB-like protein/Tfp pilus assembly protein PilF